MAHGTASTIGRFCWFELGTTDQAAAKQFYTGLFGWSSVDHAMGPDSIYTIFQLGGRDVGACYTQQPEQRAQGVPPSWATYVSVADTDASVAKASSLGGKVILPGFDVYDLGRMAVIADPAGAVFCIWQQKKHSGASVVGELFAFCWSELATRDTAAATKFYTGLFGWGTNVKAMGPMNYTEWQVDGQSIGGMLAMDAQWPANVPPHWMNYVSVPDCDESCSRAKGLGGNVCVPPTDIPNVGRFAVLTDPQGAALSVIHLKHA